MTASEPLILDGEVTPSPFRRPRRNTVLKRSRRRRVLRLGAWGMVGLLLAVGALGATGIIAMRWVTSTSILRLTDIRLHGLLHADAAVLRGRLAWCEGRNLLACDLDAARRALREDPWVADAVVRRVLPGTLEARIEERRPAALALLDGVPTLVDGFGAPIAPWDARLGELDLPLITGADAASDTERPARLRQGLEALRELLAHDPALFRRLAEVDLSVGGRIAARFTDEPAVLYIAPGLVTANLDHYFAVRSDILERLGPARVIDLRWRGRVIVLPAGGPAEATAAASLPAGPDRLGKAERDG